MCSKDSYPLPNTDKLVDNSIGYRLISFMDTYFVYNQIPMFRLDQIKITFMTEQANYKYNDMPFRLKNASTTG